MVKTKQNPKTCPSCGYDMNHCICGHQASDGSQRRRFNYFEDFRKKQDTFALTNYSVKQFEPVAVKHFIEIFPVHGEDVRTWIQRTSIHAREITENSRYYHTQGTSKPWPSHTSGRYCPMCTCCDFVDILRIFAEEHIKLYPKNHAIWIITIDDVGVNRYTIQQE